MITQIDLKKVLVLDLETVPQYASFSDVPTQTADLWTAKSSMNRLGESADAFYQRAGIWAEFGKVICVSIGLFHQHDSKWALRVKSFYGDDEYQVLEQTAQLFERQPNFVLCAHNGKEFDYPYLARRMMINCIPLPPQLQLSGKRSWEIPHLDTLELWKFGDYKHYTSLELLASILKIEGSKDDLRGSDVGEAYWERHELNRIRNYCQKDVITTSQLLMRFKNLPPIPSNLITLVE
jgi:3'-5' exonuclease